MNKKLPAFTIMEVTIAMLLSALTIGITFTAYRLVSSAYIGFSRKKEQVAAVALLDHLLLKDVEQAQSIVRTAAGLDFQMEGGLISYSLTDSILLRNQYSLRTDTFKLQVRESQFLFEGAPVSEGDLLDQLDLSIQQQGARIPLSYKKVYSAEDLFD